MYSCTFQVESGIYAASIFIHIVSTVFYWSDSLLSADATAKDGGKLVESLQL